MSTTKESTLKCSEDVEDTTTTEKVTKNKCERCGSPATFACPTCKERGIVTRSTCGHFCSKECFKLEWSKHKLQHIRKATRGINKESSIKLYLASLTSAEAISSATREGTTPFVSSDPDRLYKYWGFMTSRATNTEEQRTLQFKKPASDPSRFFQHAADQIEMEFFDERKGHVSPDIANMFVDEEWYETILLPFVSEAPTWQEFVESNCRLFSCCAALFLGVLAMVDHADGSEEICGHSLTGKVNKLGTFKLILRDQKCEFKTAREGVYVNADGEGGGLLRPEFTLIKNVDLCWDICVPFRALIPKVVLMNPPSLPYRCMTQRTSPQDVEFKFFDYVGNRHANDIQAVYLNETWFNSCIKPHYYSGPKWKEFVTSESLGYNVNHGKCHIMSVAAGLQLSLLVSNVAGKVTASPP